MSYKAIVLGLIFTTSIFASTQTSVINKVTFEGNIKVPTNKLLRVAKPYIGSPLDIKHADALAKEIEAYYHRNNYALAYTSVKKIDEENQNIVIQIGKYENFDERAVCEMKRREVIPGKINKIFFEGNKKVSTQRLTSLTLSSIGMENKQENLDEIVTKVQKYYRDHHYDLAYAEISNVDENGSVNINIKKYHSFKARYTREGKNQ